MHPQMCLENCKSLLKNGSSSELVHSNVCTCYVRYSVISLEDFLKTFNWRDVSDEFLMINTEKGSYLVKKDNDMSFLDTDSSKDVYKKLSKNFYKSLSFSFSPEVLAKINLEDNK